MNPPFSQAEWPWTEDAGDMGGRRRPTPRGIPALREEARRFVDWPGLLFVPARAPRGHPGRG